MTIPHTVATSGPRLFSMRFPVRWGEMDALGHVNNAQYLRYFEEIRVVWGETLGLHTDGKGEGMILLKSSITYRKQLVYPATVEVGLYAGEIGRSSFHLVHTLTVDGDDLPAAQGEFIVVWFDYVAGKSLQIPATLRAVLEGNGVSS